MQVHSIKGEIPERARPPREGPGIETQADIADRFRPQEDITEKTFRDVPIFSSGIPLCGPDTNVDTLASFILQYMRKHAFTREWFLAMGDELPNASWRTIVSKRDLAKYTKQDIAQVLAETLKRNDKAVAARISTDTGVSVASSDKPAKGAPSLTVWYRKR
jgi:hypothetical protein